jgi:hypothetical protein
MDHALTWVPTKLNFQVTKVKINMWSQQIDKQEATSLSEVSQLTASNSTIKNQRKMTISIFLIS